VGKIWRKTPDLTQKIQHQYFKNQQVYTATNLLVAGSNPKIKAIEHIVADLAGIQSIVAMSKKKETQLWILNTLFRRHMGW
jgi:hypothetical protein